MKRFVHFSPLPPSTPNPQCLWGMCLLTPQWYGKPHAAPDLQQEAVYCIPEINRKDIKGARIIANPGCYPTAAQLPLVPLLAAGLLETEDIIIDAKSGTFLFDRLTFKNIINLISFKSYRFTKELVGPVEQLKKVLSFARWQMVFKLTELLRTDILQVTYCCVMLYSGTIYCNNPTTFFPSSY